VRCGSAYQQMVMAARRSQKGYRRLGAFTLIELLVALTVGAVILAAVATLAYALGSVHETTEQRSRVQSEVRYATFRVCELIRQCRLVCYAGAEDAALWRQDDDGDGQISMSELVYIDLGSERNFIRLCSFPDCNVEVKLAAIGSYSTGWWSAYCPDPQEVVLVEHCSNARLLFDAAAPSTRLVRIMFETLEDGLVCQYQISAAVRSPAVNLLNETADGLVSDDD